MDLFVFPSLFEGLPVVLIEAQAAGLMCLVSDAITRETDATGRIQFISLKHISGGVGAQVLYLPLMSIKIHRDYCDKWI